MTMNPEKSDTVMKPYDVTLMIVFRRTILFLLHRVSKMSVFLNNHDNSYSRTFIIIIPVLKYYLTPSRNTSIFMTHW